MKRYFSLFITAIMSASLFCGCGSTSAQASSKKDAVETVNNNANKPVQVDVWTITNPDGGPDTLGGILWSAADDFNKANPSIHVTMYDEGGYDGVSDKLLAAIASGDMPTLAMTEESFLAQFAPVSEDLTKYVSKSTIDNYLPGLLASSYDNGVFKAVPVNRSMPGFFINKEMFEKAGLPITGPTSWAQVEEYAKKLTDKANGVYGFVGDWDSDCWLWENVLNAYGGRALSDDGKTVTWNTPAGYTIVQMYQRMIKDGSMFNGFESKGSNLASMFDNGKAAMYYNSTGSYGSRAAKVLSGEIKFHPIVTLPPKGTQVACISGGANMIMMSSSTEDQKKAAGKFLDFLAQDKYTSQIFAKTGYLATTKTCAASPEIQDLMKSDPNYKTILDQVQYIKPRPWSPQWREIYTMFDADLVEACANPDSDAKKVVSDGAKKAQDIIDTAQ